MKTVHLAPIISFENGNGFPELTVIKRLNVKRILKQLALSPTKTLKEV